ncbi:bifunctional lysylphosphatidylglycerol synthetase/lysine--tRNA ligase LysX [Brevibacterium sp. BRM-1]|uniref:bifunctional lysylphosphatidylglycerol synthetase/lysine--tRNA ligase LysX n=1 Tax=Brevibacterium sp. BRM-1 TaxID=2999062 RepID=UPI002281F3B2|nr:bifunctional lysylphosphatidylglycerol synthetase/lysine--tRNA ligase LysX [Brevibacterium sp. BRM-1]WAL40669.1 bifunctional lysylphosphatidylglycerol synthetase/lysine--tRNA ligase LysX [Brevibacterium sp. BRM-1]
MNAQPQTPHSARTGRPGPLAHAQRGGRIASLRSPEGRELVARMLAALYAYAGLAAALLWLLGRVAPTVVVWPVLASGALNIPIAPSPVSVVLLCLLAWGLKRRMRLALILVVITEVLGALISVRALFWIWTHGVRTHPPQWVALHTALESVAILACAFFIVVTWWLRPAYPARVPGRAVARAGAVLGVGLLACVLWAALMSQLTARSAEPGILSVLVSFVRSFGLGRPHSGELPSLPIWVPGTISLLISATLVLAAYVLMRPVQSTHRWSGEQEVRLRELLARWPQADALSYFATRRDREAVFAPSGAAAVTYRQQGAHSLAGGDPVGDPAQWGAAIAAWLEHCRTRGQIPVACSVSEAGARAYSAFGLAVIPLGDEAVIDVDRFDLKKAAMTPVRRAADRAARAGAQIRIRRQGEIAPAELADLGTLAEAWLRGADDRGFSMALNRWGDPADSRTVVVEALVDEAPVGLLTFVPAGASTISLDVMRHAVQAPNGVTEAMVAALVAWCGDNGIAAVSLNFVVGRRIFSESERIGAGPVTRFNSRVLTFFNRFFQLESLYRSNAKYDPLWFPRFICIPDATSLLPAGVAFSMAEGFLPEVFGRIRSTGTLAADQLERIAQLGALPAHEAPHGPRRSPVFHHRLAHARALQDAGHSPYPIGAFDGIALADLPAAGPEPAALLAAWPAARPVVARIRRLRRHGGVVFAELVDGRAHVQAVLERSALGEDFGVWEHNLDTGDLVAVTGRPGASRNGTPSVLVSAVEIESKALVPIPFDGIADPEFRARHRSLDLLTSPAELETLRQRSAVMAEARAFLTAQGLREVETPVLNTVHGGASARPFRTYINAYSADLTLRIAPELYLKRLLVAGSGPIFEFSRNFRNEGADTTHNPEFTALEAYVPFADYTVMKDLTQGLIKAAATTLFGSPRLPLGSVRGTDFTWTDVDYDWPMVPIEDALSERLGRPVGLETDVDELLAIAREHGIPIGPTMGPGAILEELYGELVEATTTAPTFYCDFPQETSPLTGPHRTKPGRVERWDLVINGMEMGTAYSELTDPVEQRRRLTEQSWKAAHGDPEAMQVDEDFLAALEAGMPPTGGMGLGMDRLVMLLTRSTIRQVLTFPFVRPRR